MSRADAAPSTENASPHAARPDAASPQINPVALLAVSALIGATLVLSIDIVSAGVALIGELLLLPFARLGWRMFWRRTAPVWIAAVFASVTTLLYGRMSGERLFSFWLFDVSEGSVALAAATLLRVLAIALPAVALFARVDPTDLADALAQVMRLPARFVLGALAGLRLASMFADDWRALELARRARGLAELNALRRFAGQAFALLVIAIRRGTKLATAMEARAFGAQIPRSWARRSELHFRDAAVVLLGAVIAGAAVAVSVAAGAWNPVFGG